MPQLGFFNEYLEEVDVFIEYICKNTNGEDVIRYPCIECNNLIFFPTNHIKNHLVCKDTLTSYDNWSFHRE